MPELDEGDFAIETRITPGSSLTEMIESTTKAEQILKQFPEVSQVVSRIGAPEIPTDPMPMEAGDVIVSLKDKSEWTTASSTPELIEKMEQALAVLPGVAFDFMFPIQMRFNELLSGVKADVAVKIYGDDLSVLQKKAEETSNILHAIEGVHDLKIEQTKGLPQILVKYKRDNIARYGVNISELNMTLRTAFAGEKIGVMYEGDRWFDLTLRLDSTYRQDIEQIKHLFISLPNGQKVPFEEVADIQYTEAPMQISRETGKRRVFLSFNVRGRDMESVVKEAQQKIEEEVSLPAGYFFDYGGQFQNLSDAK